MWHCSQHLPSLWIALCLIIPANQFISRLYSSEAMGKISSLPTQLFKCCFCDFLKVNIFFFYSLKSLGEFKLCPVFLLPRAGLHFKFFIVSELRVIYKMLNVQFHGIRRDSSERWMHSHRSLWVETVVRYLCEILHLLRAPVVLL